VDEIWAIALKNINLKNNTSTSTAKHDRRGHVPWSLHERGQFTSVQGQETSGWNINIAVTWGAPSLLPRHQILSRFLYLKDNVDGNLDIMLENDAFFRTGITWEIEGDDGVKKTGRNPRLHVTRVPKIINGNVHFTRFCITC